MDINFVCIQGRLGQDASQNATASATYLNFSVATNTGGTERLRTNWTRINYRTSSEKELTFLAKHLVKGAKVNVSGELCTLDANDGQKMVFVRASALKLLTFVEDGPAKSHADDVDPELAALGFDSEPRPARSPQAVPSATRGRDLPAVAQQRHTQEPALVPAAGGEVVF